MSITIFDCTKGRSNNFDFLRFLAASAVIFSHSFPLSLGNEKSEPFNLLTNGQSTLGHLSVLVFFITSGFLITQSFDRSQNVFNYTKARVLRIFPALIVTVILTAFVLGPLVSSYSPAEYFSDARTYEYLKTITLLSLPNYLPGVFENNLFEGSVNGSLWSLKYEFAFYIVVAVLGVSGLLKRNVVLFLSIITIALSSFTLPFGQRSIDMFAFFSSGMIFYLYRERIKLSGKFALLSIVVLLFTMKVGFFIQAFAIFGSYLVFYFAFSKKVKLYSFSKYGDFSYGLYIFAFPIQQTLTYFSGGSMNNYINFLISYPITLIFAIFSWHLIEKRALKYKNAFNFKKEKFNEKLREAN